MVCVNLGKEKNKGKEKPTMFGSVYLKKKKSHLTVPEPAEIAVPQKTSWTDRSINEDATAGISNCSLLNETQRPYLLA